MSWIFFLQILLLSFFWWVMILTIIQYIKKGPDDPGTKV